MEKTDIPYKDEIVIVSNYYYPEPTGSAPPISDLSFWLAEQGLEPSVVSARPSYPINQVYPGYEDGKLDRESLRGVNVRRAASFIPKSRGLIGRLLGEASFAISATASKTRRYRGVICVCPSVFVVLIAPLFKRRDGRLVAIVHDIQSGLAASLQFGAGRPLMHLLRKIEAWSLNRCNAVIALSPAMADELKHLGVKAPIFVIPPQVDVREIIPTAEPQDEAPLILYSGNLGRKQGLDQVLDLAEELKARGSNAKLLVRGEGSERLALEAVASERGLDNLSFADLAPRSDISAALGQATLHLVPQSPGGANFALPSKIFSIMAAQRAYVATAEQGTPLDFVTRQSGGGVCVAPNRPDLFADAVQGLLRDPAARSLLGASGRRHVEQTIDREVVCRDILNTLTGQGLVTRGA